MNMEAGGPVVALISCSHLGVGTSAFLVDRRNCLIYRNRPGTRKELSRFQLDRDQQATDLAFSRRSSEDWLTDRAFDPGIRQSTNRIHRRRGFRSTLPTGTTQLTHNLALILIVADELLSAWEELARQVWGTAHPAHSYPEARKVRGTVSREVWHQSPGHPRRRATRTDRDVIK